MDQVQEAVAVIAKQVEKNIDEEMERLNTLDQDDLEQIRQQRLAELKKRAQLKQEWRSNGHGEYTELSDEKEFFDASKKSPNMVAHFYTNDNQRCKILDQHLRIVAKQHVETRFVKIDAERAPFLTGRLKIRVIPTMAIVKDHKTVDYIVGFTDLGNRDDFTTEILEWRLARTGVIEYSGDILVPPEVARKEKSLLQQKKKTIKGGTQSDDDSDLDFSD